MLAIAYIAISCILKCKLDLHPKWEKKKKTNVAWLGQAQRSLVFNITEHRNTVTVLFMWQLINIMQLE